LTAVDREVISSKVEDSSQIQIAISS
jgi:hypothetical protein